MLEDLKPPKRNFTCKVAAIMATLDDKDKKILEDVINADKNLWPAKTLSSELAKRGIQIVDTTITKHRTKACWCYRDR